jgi:ribonuclease HI
MRFFTDGGAQYPRHCNARIATWAVVQDISLNETQIKQAADFVFLVPPQFPKFHVPAVGIVPGEQTVARAELFAILHATKQVNLGEPIPKVEFVTDASYVCRVIQIIEQDLFRHTLHKFSNGDLIQELAEFWHADRFTVTKVKSHRALESARDLYDLWYIAGNMCADAAVGSAYEAIPSEVRKLADNIVSHIDREKNMLDGHLQFLADFNKARCLLLEEKKEGLDSAFLD